jgi:mono/diheme cytochrome c family protein
MRSGVLTAEHSAMNNRLLQPLIVLLAIAGSFRSARAAQGNHDTGLDKVVKPFFDEHCTRCHGEKKQKGDLRLDTLAIEFDSPKTMGHWLEIMGRINSGEMPPEKQPRPKAEDIARVSEWIAGQLREADAAQQSSGDKIAFCKLSREEYANTIRDLLGVKYDAMDPTGLPEDPDWHGFQRIASTLTFSPAHVEKYLAAAELVLGEALALGSPPKSQIIHWSPSDIRGGGWKNFEKEYEARGILDKVRADLVPNNGALDTRDLSIKTAGEYIVRVKLSGLRPKGGRAPRLRLYAGDISRVLYDGDVEAPEDKPVTIEFRTHLPVGSHDIRIVNDVAGPNPTGRRSRASGTPNAFTGLDSRVPWQLKFTDDDGKPIVPFLLLDYVEWEGPIVESWPTAAHQRIFFGGSGAKNDPAYAREILGRFAERAFRHPVPPAEVDRLMKLFDQSQKLGDDFESSVKTALLAVLCSNSFLYIEEGSAESVQPRLTDWELASRLSYFLWSSMPDQRLLDLARDGKLHETETLRAEVRRMLADPKAAEFSQSFPYQWLQLRRVGMFAPDKVLYPEYDEYLETSMLAETIGFFRDVLARNASLREFLDSDWTMLNERLAEHYGISGVHGEAMQRVSLKPGDHRGGVLTQGAILSLTSDGTRHRPVHRGVWVLESMIGKPPPPPPANVPPLNTPDPNAPKTTLRQKLESHRSDPNCAACHRRIDPLGLAFDNYDAVGHWRTEETTVPGAGAAPKLDPSGELADGRKFDDAAGLKHLLLDDSDKFAGAFTEKLATYAFRRAMTFSDRIELQHVTEQSKANGYKLQSLIESLVTSDLFLKR